MLKRILLVLLCVFVNTLLSDEEVFVEVESDENSEYSDQEASPRNGRLFWSQFSSPFTELFVQAAGNYHGLLDKSDLFDVLRDSYPLPQGLSEPYSEYDFVIIGAGSGGCALANRLSRNRNTTVLLLEVGKPEMITTDMPAIAPYFQSTDYTWQYYMEHQPGVCMGMQNERCFWPRGKAIGGSSVVNYMIYTRGRPQDWDRIAADGNYGWSYNDVLKYYIDLEKSSLKGLEKQPHRGRDGDLPVEFIPRQTKLLESFLEGGTILGHPTVDYNAPQEFGFGPVQVTISGGRRQSAAKVFLHTHKKRPNLHILPESRATKILIDPNTKSAYGVEYIRKKMLHTVHARKEVIVSAGPIASPQLLMLSGVGPKDHLSSVGIPTIHDSPVGRVLYDHISFPGLIFTLNETGIAFLESEITDLPHMLDWLKNGDNELTTPGGVEGIGYIKTNISDDPDPTVPDIELIDLGGSFLSDGGSTGSKAIRRGMRLSDSIIDEAYGPIDATETWCVVPMLLHPKSFGRIDLKDNNPLSHPKMYGNYLNVKSDVDTFVEAIRHIQKLSQTAPFQRLGVKLYPALLKTCKNFVFDTNEYWECVVRTFTATLHHQIATCRMGPDNDPLAVVDPELRVRGIQKLRVVDTSVIPRTISAHTNAPGMMIGLKAADMIKKQWDL